MNYVSSTGRAINLKIFNELAVIIKAMFLTFNPIININFRIVSIWGKVCLRSCSISADQNSLGVGPKHVCLKKKKNLQKIFFISYPLFSVL